MKKKLINYLFIFFLTIINFQSKIFATEISDIATDNRDACNLFYQKLSESKNLRVRNWFGDSWFGSFGFYPVYEYNETQNKWEILTDGKKITNSYNYSYDTANLLKPGTEILKIDGVDAAKLFADMSIWDEFVKSKDQIELEIIDENKKIKNINLKKGSHYYGTTNFYLEDLKITNIDIKNSTFTSRISNVFQFEFSNLKDVDHPIIAIAKETLVYKMDDGKYFRHMCRPNNEYFNNGILQNPASIIYPNVVKNDKDLETIDNKITLFLKMAGNLHDEIIIGRSFTNNFVVSNEFNLKSFPFDKQTLKFKLMEDRYGIDKRILHSKGFISRAFNEYLEKDDIPGWKKISASINNYDQKKVTHNKTLYSGLVIELKLERKHGYYIFKVIFPIILILMVCWSVVWVDPKELEARLTITIVCLLSLIAYNFVIDSELPKLEYLTVLDWIVLISYVYATVPNFLSIISFRLQKTNLKLSNKLEQISKRYGLSSYVLSIFVIVLLNANLNPDNSSSLISWMAGR
jgi:hypothetical protein